MQNTVSIRAQISRVGLENSGMGMGTLKGEPGEERSALRFFSILQEVRLEVLRSCISCKTHLPA